MPSSDSRHRGAEFADPGTLEALHSDATLSQNVPPTNATPSHDGQPSNATLSHDAALVWAGTLLAPDGTLVAPYDLEHAGGANAGHVPAAPALGLLHAARCPFRLAYDAGDMHVHVHVINGMGVALGDSVIGLTALAALRDAHPGLRFTLYRPYSAPRYVESLYAMATDIVAPSRSLPWPADALPAHEPRIDIGNHVYWPDFARLPMIDFFLAALGADPAAIPASAKCNRWLARLKLPALPPAWQRPYVLFCPSASTALRSVPPALRAHLVDQLARRYRMPVAGFGPLDHPAYVDVNGDTADTTGMDGTARFISWIASANVLFSADTAAPHIAAAFDVPTLACFTTIAPTLRTRDYPHCVALALDVPDRLHGLHASELPDDIAAIEDAYRAIEWSAVNWPAPRDNAAP